MASAGLGTVEVWLPMRQDRGRVWGWGRGRDLLTECPYLYAGYFYYFKSKCEKLGGVLINGEDAIKMCGMVVINDVIYCISFYKMATNLPFPQTQLPPGQVRFSARFCEKCLWRCTPLLSNLEMRGAALILR